MEVEIANEYEEAKKQRAGKSRDRLSNLHVTLLHHILSFLPTKYVVQTSVLSKRWRHEWTQIPYLDFDDTFFLLHNTQKINTRFLDFVDLVLMLHHGPSIEKLCLSFGNYCHIYRLNAWIRYAVTRGIRELDLNMLYERSIKLPRILFNCESLEVLKLSLNTSIKFSLSIPRLKTLHLTGIRILDANLVSQIFSDCPHLEEFKMKNCNLGKPKIFNITAHALKSLTIDSCVDFSECNLKLSTPSLKRFSYITFIMAQDYSIENLPSIVNAVIKFIGSYHRERMNGRYDASVEGQKLLDRFSEIFEKLCDAKALTLCNQCIDFLVDEQDLLQHFPNLEYLELTASPTFSHLDVISYFIANCPNLLNVVIHLTWKIFGGFYINSRKLRSLAFWEGRVKLNL
ncbi:F-box/LRR-repeat protein At3g26922-like isoform X2 [Tasmannia lanceolata]|uniref:F-box/LRR-repeat protein At3g26922-like isoform X2 n=1 Tax=Tasmannia lanceolata TaxID=3420 RepID=UPI0040628FEA